MPAIPQPPEHFGDDLIELREIAEWDIPEVLIAFQDDRDLHKRIGMAKPPTGAQLGREVEQELEERLAGRSVKLTIVEPSANDCRGRVDIDTFDWERRTASMRIWAAPQVRGRGYEQRAAELASRWLFDNVALESVVVTVDGADTHTLVRGDSR
jgi:RimJ/RimL family protein N-acetyltransferase